MEKRFKNIIFRFLRKVIDGKYHYPHDSEKNITLVENDLKNDCNPIVLIKSKEQTFTIEADRNKENLVKDFLYGHSADDTLIKSFGNLSVADFVIFCHYRKTFFVVIAELKSSKSISGKKKYEQANNIAKVIESYLIAFEKENSENILAKTEFRTLFFSPKQDRFSIKTKRNTTVREFTYKSPDENINFKYAFKDCGRSYKLSMFLK